MVSGIGQHAAATAAQQLIDAGADGLLSAGMAGALSQDLKAGDLLLPDTVSTDTGLNFHCNPEWHKQVVPVITNKLGKPYCGELLSTQKIISTSDDKLESAKYGAIAVDMESAGILHTASEHQVPALVIRTVIDPLNYSIPDHIVRNHDQYGEIDSISLVRSVLFRPAQLLKLMSLGRYYHAARKSLLGISDNLELILMQANKNN